MSGDTHYGMRNLQHFIFWCSAIHLYRRYGVSWLIPRLLISIVTGGAVYIYLTKQIAKLFIAWNF